MGFPVSTRATDDLITAAIWNADLVANLNNSVMHLIAHKSVDESLTSNTTLQDDDTLFAASVGANQVWRFYWELIYDAATSGDIKVAFTFPSGRIDFSTTFADETGAVTFRRWNTSTSPATSLGLIGPGGPIVCPISGVFANGATPGDCKLQWAQNTSFGTATIMKAHSTLWGVQLA